MLSEAEIHKIRNRVQGAMQGAGKEPFLYGYDVVGIQQFIGSRGRPIAMHGASQAVKDVDGQNNSFPLSVFSGGGRGIGLAQSEHEATERGNLLRSLHRKAGGVLATAQIPFARQAERSSILWLRAQLEQAKDEASAPPGVLPPDKASQCETCALFCAEQTVQYDDQTRRICQFCWHALQHGRQSNAALRKSLIELSPRHLIAAVSGDGNHMGRFFDTLETLEQYAIASAAIQQVFAAAHATATKKLAFPSVPMITGGDDIRIFVAVEDVVSYVTALVTAIEDNAQNAAAAIARYLPTAASEQLRSLGIGIGVLIAPDKHPASLLLEYVHLLEESAKAICQQTHEEGQKPARSAMDLELLTSRDAFVNGRPTRSHPDCRPFRMESWEEHHRRATALRAVPSSQVAALATASTMDDTEFRNLFRYQVARNKEWQQYFQKIQIDWRRGEDLDRNRPDPGILALYRVMSEVHS